MTKSVTAFLSGLWLLAGAAALAVDDAGKPPVDAASEKQSLAAPSEGELTNRQTQVGEKFRELKAVLIHMAELTAATDPRRAGLLRKAVSQANERGIDGQFEALIELLKAEQLSKAVKGQGEVKQDLDALLELLLSEDRSKRLESEKEQIRGFIKRVNQLIKQQKVIQAETGDGNTDKLAGEESKLSEQTGELAKNIAEHAGKHSSAGGKPSEGNKPGTEDQENPDGSKKDDKNEKGEGKDDGKKPETENADGKKSDGQGTGKSEGKGEGKPDSKGEGKGEGKADSKGDGKGDGKGEGKGEGKGDGKGEGKGQGHGQGEGEGGEQPPQQQQQPANPAQQRLEQAQERMKEAQRKLEQAKRSEAKDKQDEALRELEQAKAELEEILRQLREEEIARMLAALEQRFRKMLQMQIAVYEGTKRIDKIPENNRDRDDEIEAGRLSRKESEIVGEADRAMAVLAEDGTAVAFPEAVLEMREDMEQVVVRLAQAKVNMVTQGIEEDIIAALEEMIEALKKAQKELRDRRPPPPGQPGEPQEDPLVDAIAELKMIRALQMRVNRRTQRYGELIKGEQADRPDLLQALDRLAEREERIYRVTRDIVAGRNK